MGLWFAPLLAVTWLLGVRSWGICWRSGQYWVIPALLLGYAALGWVTLDWLTHVARVR